MGPANRASEKESGICYHLEILQLGEEALGTLTAAAVLGGCQSEQATIHQGLCMLMPALGVPATVAPSCQFYFVCESVCQKKPSACPLNRSYPFGI